MIIHFILFFLDLNFNLFLLLDSFQDFNYQFKMHYQFKIIIINLIYQMNYYYSFNLNYILLKQLIMEL